MAIRRITDKPKIKVPFPKKKIVRKQPAPKKKQDKMTAQEQGVVTARKTLYKEGVVVDETQIEHRVPVPNFEGPVARTRVSMGVTKSLGGYEFVRLDVSVELPCQPNPDDLRETNEFAAAKVDEFMQRELDAVETPAVVAPAIDHRTNVSALIDGNQ